MSVRSRRGLMKLGESARSQRNGWICLPSTTGRVRGGLLPNEMRLDRRWRSARVRSGASSRARRQRRVREREPCQRPRRSSRVRSSGMASWLPLRRSEQSRGRAHRRSDRRPASGSASKSAGFRRPELRRTTSVRPPTVVGQEQEPQAAMDRERSLRDSRRRSGRRSRCDRARDGEGRCSRGRSQIRTEAPFRLGRHGEPARARARGTADTGWRGRDPEAGRRRSRGERVSGGRPAASSSSRHQSRR